jgi:hypothetical protein
MLIQAWDRAPLSDQEATIGRSDALNEYVKHVRSGVWAVPPGAAVGGRDAAGREPGVGARSAKRRSATPGGRPEAASRERAAAVRGGQAAAWIGWLARNRLPGSTSPLIRRSRA